MPERASAARITMMFTQPLIVIACRSVFLPRQGASGRAANNAHNALHAICTLIHIPETVCRRRRAESAWEFAQAKFADRSASADSLNGRRESRQRKCSMHQLSCSPAEKRLQYDDFGPRVTMRAAAAECSGNLFLRRLDKMTK